MTALSYCRASDTGRRNSNLAPLPFCEVKRRAEPPASSMRLRTIARPSPVPLCRVVKNGSQILARVSAAMPGPLSFTANTTSPFSSKDSTVTWPPLGVACRAFRRRFARASRRAPACTPSTVLRRADENWLVSGQGRVLRKLQGRLRRPLPVVWIPRSFEPDVGTVIRAGEPARGVEAVATIHADAPTFSRRVWYVTSAEQGLTIVLRDRFELRLGPATDIALKVAVARRVLAALQSSDSNASYLDVSVPERPVAGTTLDSQVEP